MEQAGEQAGDYFARTVGVGRPTADEIVAECAVLPGRGCAGEAGRQEIMRLRDDARAALGGKFDVRDFHAAVLAPGEAPLSVVNSNVAAWIGATKPQKAF